MMQTMTVDVAIIGAGTAGLYALREVRRAGKRFVLIDQGPLGTTCARVGCMPSKVALHGADLWRSRQDMADYGIAGGDSLTLDRSQTWQQVRTLRDGFAAGPVRQAHQAGGDNLLMGRAEFVEPTLLKVTTDKGEVQVRAASVVIANGSQPVVPGWLESVRDRVVTTDELFELTQLPARIGVLGLGAVGLEMGLALSRLGVAVTGAEMAGLAGIDDPVVAARAQEVFGQELELWLGEAASVSRTDNGLLLQSGDRRREVDLVVVALGRRPNVAGLNLAAAGFALDARGMPLFDPATLQLGDYPVFIAGDVNGQRALMHEAADEGSMAGYNACRDRVTCFRRKTPLGIVFSNPDIATVGARFSALDEQHILIGSASGEANGRLRVLGGQSSLIRLYAEATTGRLLGGTLFCVQGEHLAHLLAWAIERGETAQSLLQMPFYHPVVEELLATALQSIAKHFASEPPLPFGLVEA